MKKAFIYLGLIAILLSSSQALAGLKEDLALYKAAGDRSKKCPELIEPGFQAFDSDNVATSLVFFQKAYEAGCRDGLALFKLGIVYERLGRFPDAMKVLDEAIPLLKKNYPSHEFTKQIDAHLGMLYYRSDQYDKAGALLEAALKSDPNNFMLLFITGQLLRLQKNFTEAYARYKLALAIPPPTNMTPDPKVALMKELMIVSYELKNEDECFEYAKQVLAINPRDKTARSYYDSINTKKMMEKQDLDMKQMMERIK